MITDKYVNTITVRQNTQQKKQSTMLHKVSDVTWRPLYVEGPAAATARTRTRAPSARLSTTVLADSVCMDPAPCLATVRIYVIS